MREESIVGNITTNGALEIKTKKTTIYNAKEAGATVVR